MNFPSHVTPPIDDQWEQPRFAVLDDADVMGELVKTMLSKSGFETELFLLSKELLDSPNLMKFRSIVMDLSVPDIDGFDLMEILASRKISVPITIMSGHDEGVCVRPRSTAMVLG